MSRLLLAVVVTAGLVACAGRERRPEMPAASAARLTTAPPDASATPDAGEDTGSAPAPSPPAGPTYGERLRGEVLIPPGELERARMRQWLAPLRRMDTRGCSGEVSAEHFQCWCERVCGLRFEEGSGALTISWPFTDTDGPGFEVAADGHVRACFYSVNGQIEYVPHTRVTCPVRTTSRRGRR